MNKEDVFSDEFEEDIYDSTVVDDLMESDEISDSEDAFLKGYDSDLDSPLEDDDVDIMLCPNCGERIKIDVLICPVCRQNIEKAISF